MEANGSWLVATHLAAGIDFGIAPLPKGPAGRFTSINPTGAVVFKGTKNPDAAWEFVKYLASPAAQTKLMELKASLPANKAVLSGPFATSFDGAEGPRRRDRLRPYQAVVQGLQRLDDRAPDRARRERLQREPNKTARQAVDKVLTQARRASSPASDAAVRVAPESADDQRPPPRPAGGAARWPARRAGRCLFLAPTLIGLAVLSAGPILATLGISLTKWDLLTAPSFVGLDNYTPSWRDDRFLAGPPQHVLLHGDVRADRARHRPRPGARAQPADPRHRLDPDRLLPAGRHLDDRRSPSSGSGSTARTRACSTRPSGWSASRPSSGSNNPTLAMPAIVAMSIWQGLGVNVIIFLAGLQAIPEELLDAASVDGAGRWARFRGVVLPLLTPSIFFTGVLGAHRQLPGLRPDLRPGQRRGRPTRRSRSSTSSTRTASSSSRWATRAPRRGSCSSSWRAVHRDLLPVAGPLGALPVSARRPRPAAGSARGVVRRRRRLRSAHDPAGDPHRTPHRRRARS